MLGKPSIKTALFVIITSMCLMLSMIIIGIFYYTSTKTANSLINNIVSLTSTHIVDKTANYLQIADRISTLTGGLARSGVVKTGDDAQIRHYFRNILMVNERFATVYYADLEGNFLMAKRMSDGSISFKEVLRKDESIITSWEHDNKEYAKDFGPATDSLEKGFDARTRPWYIKSVENRDLEWTDVYVFFTDKNIGVSCAAPIIAEGGQLTGVVGIDIPLNELSRFLSTLNVTQNSKSFIVSDKKRMIAYPIASGDFSVLMKESDKALETIPVEHFADPAVASAYEALEKAPNKSDVLTFKAGNQDYIGSIAAFNVSKNWQWYVGLIVPKNDFEGPLIEARNINVTIAMLGILIFIFLSYLLAQNISRPLGELEQNMSKVKRFDLALSTVPDSHFKEIDSISSSFSSMITGLRSFEKYVPKALVRQLLLMGKEAHLGGEKKPLTVFFSDIAGFTSISEKLTADELVKFLSVYLSDLTNVITQEKGTVDKYIGDAIMAFWGAPNEFSDHAVRACEAALTCQEHIKLLSAKSKDIPNFFTRIGIHTGEAVVGNVGSETRLNYTILGDTVNTASRLESINKYYGTTIIISEATFKEIGPEFFCRPIDFVKLKGKEHAITMYELINKTTKVSKSELEQYAHYERALDQYKAQKWDEAISGFNAFKKWKGKDQVCDVLIGRCEEFKKNPPPADWCGEFAHDHK